MSSLKVKPSGEEMVTTSRRDPSVSHGPRCKGNYHYRDVQGNLALDPGPCNKEKETRDETLDPEPYEERIGNEK